jgi:hypothetical protein
MGAGDLGDQSEETGGFGDTLLIGRSAVACGPANGDGRAQIEGAGGGFSWVADLVLGQELRGGELPPAVGKAALWDVDDVLHELRR